MAGRASAYFAFAAVVVAAEDEPAMRAAMSDLRRDFNVPNGKPLHWKDHVKTFPRRQHCVRKLAGLPLVINYVAVEKAAIPANAGMRADQTKFYNFAAGMVLERILLTAKHWSGGSRDVKVRFGMVRGFDHRETSDYFKLKPQSSPSWVPWRLQRGAVEFDAQAHYDGLQAADVYAGILHAAIVKDAYGGYEESHLMSVRSQIRRSQAGDSWGYGFKWLGNDSTVKGLPWWPTTGL